MKLTIIIKINFYTQLNRIIATQERIPYLEQKSKLQNLYV